MVHQRTADPAITPTSMPGAIRRITLISSACSLVAFIWLVTAGSFSLFAQQPRAADFYEAQARSFLDGQWAIEPDILGIEAFEIDGEDQTYFGIVPALARVPIVAVTDSLDGRLTQTSLVLGAAVAMAAASSLSWTVRGLARGDIPVDRADLLAAAVVPLVVGSGSLLPFLASRAWVYHEASLWGFTFSLVTATWLTRHLMTGRDRDLVVAGVAAAAALHTRPSVGAGALAMLAMLILVESLSWLGGWQVRREAPGGLWRWLAGIRDRVTAGRSPHRMAIASVVVLLAVAGYAGVHLARFGEPFRVPFETQTYVRISPERQEVLAANGGSFFGLRFVPTTALQYLRPDGISIGRTYPFIGFADAATVVGDVQFDTIDPTASIPSSMPALTVGALFGVGVVVQSVRRRGAERVLALPTAGAAVGAASCLTIAYVAHRYLADALPFLVVAALPALHRIVDLRPRRRHAVVAGTAALVAWSILANASLGLLYQRQEAPDVPDELRAALVRDQLRADRFVPFALPPESRWGSALPGEVDQGVLFGLDGCPGLYWGAGDRWRGVERTEATGGWTLDVTWPTDGPGIVRPLLSSGGPATANVLVAVRDEDGRLRVGYAWDDADGERQIDLGRPFSVDETSRVEVVFDPVTVEIRVTVDGRLVYEGYRFRPTPGEVVGTSQADGEIADTFGSDIVARTRESVVCSELAARTVR
jgi:hypothetical protein